MSKRDVWPVIRSRWVAWAAPIASSSPSSSWAACPIESSAPTLISASSTLRLHSRRSMRVQKSVSERNGPPSSRAAMINSMAPWPTFLTASRPNRIASPSTVNSRWLVYDVGRPASMPIRRHSATAAATFSSFDRERGQDRRHVLDGVVRLEVRGLVGDQAVAGGVRPC